MRFVLVLSTVLPLSALACTTFVITQDGRTLVGCNEDAWSINAQVRFEQGRNGDYGAIYFGHFNGSPLREMTDQMGMNEAGLVFDGLAIQAQSTTTAPGLNRLHFDELMPLVMRTCATVHEAAALLRTYDQSWLTRSMLFLADRNGDYLIVESDTMILGKDHSYAVGNWRMSTCADPDAIPIPRLQAGRTLLADGIDASIEQGTAVLESMKACRSKLGEGTLFSTLFDLERGQAHLFFYHDFREHITFDLKAELAKGDRTIEMASLFGERPEYDALVTYVTPFHQRWLFWGLLGLAAFAGLLGLASAATLIRRSIARLRGRAYKPWLPALLAGFICSVVLVLVPVLLWNEGVFYFGLGDVAGWLRFIPLLLILLLVTRWLMERKSHGTGRQSLIAVTALGLPFVALLAYWGMLWP